MSSLNPEKALIFRITHIDNVAWILDHGLHCRNSAEFDPSFRNIGSPDLIQRLFNDRYLQLALDRLHEVEMIY